MKEEKHNIKRWLFWFSLALAVIVLYNVLGNLTGIGRWIGNLMNVLMPFFLGLLIAYTIFTM